jgi:hypothetical protein
MGGGHLVSIWYIIRTRHLRLGKVPTSKAVTVCICEVAFNSPGEYIIGAACTFTKLLAGLGRSVSESDLKVLGENEGSWEASCQTLDVLGGTGCGTFIYL